MITEGVFESKWVYKEIRTALALKRNIFPVLDERLKFPDPSEQPDRIREALSVKAIPYHREKDFRQVSMRKIFQSIQ